MQHDSEASTVGLILSQDPRLLLGDIAVDEVDELLDSGDASGEVEGAHRVVSGLHDARKCVDKHALGIREVVRGGELAVEVAADHRGRARGEIAQTVGELGGVSRRHVLPGERAVLTELDCTKEVIAERIRSEVVDDLRRRDAGELGLTHLLAADEQPAVREHLVRQCNISGHQHRRPVDRVETKDVLAHKMHIRRPRLRELLRVGRAVLSAVTHSRGVVEQRVEPHVDHLRGVPRQRDTPRHARARHGDVGKTLLDKRHHFVVRATWLHRIGVRLVVRDQPILEG